MRKLILHIGRHKTGTSAIQKYLHANRGVLSDNGYYYPHFGLRGSGHHEIGAQITRQALKSSNYTTLNVLENLQNRLFDEMSKDNSVVLISSESFQNCNPEVVKQLFQGFDVTVVVYLREQTQYLLSAYAQLVQASNYCGTLEEFYRRNSAETYLGFLKKWENAFSGKICVKVYETTQLISNDVVLDFCVSILGLDSAVVSASSSKLDANPSLTRDLLEFKLRVNRNGGLAAPHAATLYNALACLSEEGAGNRLQISKKLAREVYKRYSRSNRLVAQKYFGRKSLFSPYVITEQTIPTSSLETRMGVIQQRLIHREPVLSSCLCDVLA